MMLSTAGMMRYLLSSPSRAESPVVESLRSKASLASAEDDDGQMGSVFCDGHVPAGGFSLENATREPY